jgi:mannose-6-phosphate isomerase-like protein (cupin superfamily)
MAKNENNKLYIPFQFQLQMSGYDLSVKYLEKLDETCVEFTHTHVNFEIYYILSGRMRMQIGGEERLLLPNHFILIPPGMRHGAVYEPDEPKEYVVFVYGVHRGSEPSALRRTPEYAFMEQVDQTIADRPFIIAEDRNGCAAVLSAIQNEAHGRQAGWQIILVDYCREYLIKLLRNVLTDGARASVQSDTGQGNLAVEITKFMHEHLPREHLAGRRREGFPHHTEGTSPGSSATISARASAGRSAFTGSITRRITSAPPTRRSRRSRRSWGIRPRRRSTASSRNSRA